MAELSAEALQLLLNTGRNLHANTVRSNGDLLMLVPEGYTVQRFEKEKPEFITQAVSINDDKSFENYVNNYSLNGRSILFADDVNGSATVILNYHAGREGNIGDGEYSRGEDWFAGPEAVGPGTHVVKYAFRKSEAWKAWMGVNNRALSQRDLAEFLEEHIDDVIHPDAATLMELVNSLQVTKIVDIKSKINLSNGNQQWNCSEEDNPKIGGVPVVVPKKLGICIPVFDGDEPYAIEAFFRYRMNDKSLSFEVRFQKTTELFTEAARAKVRLLAEAVELDALFGGVSGR